MTTTDKTRVANKARTVGDLLLRWYYQQQRTLPWRNDTAPDAYYVWLSEVMLQQTTYATVQNRFLAFIDAFPDIHSLAESRQEEVLKHWAGLGYYARARNLHKCAQIVVSEHAGMFPQTVPQLRSLPGIGIYTAAAIAAIAFDQPGCALEANSKRIYARLQRHPDPITEQHPDLQSFFTESRQQYSPRDHLQAWMDFGETVCKAKQPQCLLCPLQTSCLGHDIAEKLPVRPIRKPRHVLYAHAYWLERDGSILLQRRPANGLLGGMLCLPMSEWTEVPPPLPVSPKTWITTGKPIRHLFTHIDLNVQLYQSLPRTSSGFRQNDELWQQFQTVATTNARVKDVFDRRNPMGFPSLVKKIIAQATQNSLQNLSEKQS